MTTPPITCPQCSTPVSVAGDDREGTMHYVNADGSEHVHTPPTGIDEMPEAVPKDLFCPIWVGCAIVNARIEIRDRGDDAGEAGALVWCADALGSEGRKIKSLRSALEKAERERDALRAALQRSVKVIHPLAEGSPVQYLGVYVLKWEERDRPEYGFVEWNDDEIDALVEAARAVHHIPDSEEVK